MAPDATVLTTSGFVSTPTTCMPRLAMSAAVGRPIYPRPITSILSNSGIENRPHDTLTRASVSERIVCTGHRQIVVVVVEQPHCLVNDSDGICADEASGTCVNAFRTFRRLAHHKNRFTKRRRLLLNAA